MHGGNKLACKNYKSASRFFYILFLANARMRYWWQVTSLLSETMKTKKQERSLFNQLKSRGIEIYYQNRSAHA